MSTRRGLVNNLFLGAGVGANLYGAYFVLAFQGYLPPDWLPGALLGYDDAVARAPRANALYSSRLSQRSSSATASAKATTDKDKDK